MNTTNTQKNGWRILLGFILLLILIPIGFIGMWLWVLALFGPLQVVALIIFPGLLIARWMYLIVRSVFQPRYLDRSVTLNALNAVYDAPLNRNRHHRLPWE